MDSIEINKNNFGHSSNYDDSWQRIETVQNEVSSTKMEASSSLELKKKLIKRIGNNNGKKKGKRLLDAIEELNHVIGETPLHIAMTSNDLTTVKFLIESKDYCCNHRSLKETMLPGFTSKSGLNAIKNSKYVGVPFFGEYPLAFAACFSNKEIYDYLISKGADPNLQDSYGNTVLHILVINNKLDMFKYAVKHPVKMADITIKNHKNLTPLCLAAKLGRVELFTEILEMRKVEYWRYYNIGCSAYLLDGLDSISEDGKIEWNSALNFIINGNTNDHLEMFEGGVVRRLLDDKWRIYVKRRYFVRLWSAAFHLLVLSIAVYCREPDKDNLLVWPVTSATTWVRYITEVMVVVSCIYNLVSQIKRIYDLGILYNFKNLIAEPAKVSFHLACILTICAVPFRFIKFSDIELSRRIEDTLIMIAIPFSWIFLLFFARVANLTGPFVVMIYKMIGGDMLKFSSIYIIVVFSVSVSFYYLFKNGTEAHAFEDLGDSILVSFQMTLGEFKDRIEDFEKCSYSNFLKVMFVVFMIIGHILLLNILIAMMGHTYQQITEKSEKEWRRQWAHIVILLERTFSAGELKKYRNEYSFKLQGKDGQDLLALMVIKKTTNTKAYQKKNAIKNWKNLCKKVIAMLKETNCSNLELSRGKIFSINTNVNVDSFKSKKPNDSLGLEKYRNSIEIYSKKSKKKKLAKIETMTPLKCLTSNGTLDLDNVDSPSQLTIKIKPNSVNEFNQKLFIPNKVFPIISAPDTNVGTQEGPINN